MSAQLHGFLVTTVLQTAAPLQPELQRDAFRIEKPIPKRKAQRLADARDRRTRRKRDRYVDTRSGWQIFHAGANSYYYVSTIDNTLESLAILLRNSTTQWRLVV